MSYRALYRVWRSQRFEDVVGQEHVTQTLMNALKEGHLSHAYLFNGPRGTGKTSVARILAKAVNCEHGPAPEPCNECEACRRITEGAIMDVVEIDAASNRGVDEIRDLRDKVKYAPTEVRYKVYIIDEVHMLTTEAFNALLKTLEEPPAHVIFILATTEPHKLPPTIISRCQRFTFRRIAFDQIVGRLRLICESQQVEFDDSALVAIARAADGGMRDALSLLDQALAFGRERLDERTVLAVTGAVSREALLDIIQAIINRDPDVALSRLDELVMNGLEPEKMIHDLTYACRDLLLLKTAPQLSEIQGGIISGGIGKELAERCSVAQLTEVLDSLIQYQQQMKWVAYPRILLEMAIVRLCQPQSTTQPTVQGESSEVVRELQERVRLLEQLVKQLSQSPPVAVSDQTESVSETKQTVKKLEKRVASSSHPSLQDNWTHQLSSEDLAQVKRAWPEILHRVKEEKITVHAWLIDGEPVGATKEAVILAFKSKIHRETTEKEANKSIIQQVMGRVLGAPKILKTMMVSDWEAMRTQLHHSSSTPVVEEASKDENEDIGQKAIQLFGERVVEMVDHP